MQRKIGPIFIFITIQHAQMADPLPNFLGSLLFIRGKLLDPALDRTGTDHNIKHTCQQLVNPFNPCGIRTPLGDCLWTILRYITDGDFIYMAMHHTSHFA